MPRVSLELRPIGERLLAALHLTEGRGYPIR
jgi:hypothetical protein